MDITSQHQKSFLFSIKTENKLIEYMTDAFELDVIHNRFTWTIHENFHYDIIRYIHDNVKDGMTLTINNIDDDGELGNGLLLLNITGLQHICHISKHSNDPVRHIIYGKFSELSN
jgi:hypothetical protein